MEPNKKTHFTTVMVLYFIIKGFTITIYIDHATQLINIKISPTNTLFPVVPGGLKNKIINAPAVPVTMPAMRISGVFPSKKVFQ